MNKTLFCLSLLLAGAVHADPLADANKLHEAKAYAQALQIYTQLAGGGNAEAQFRLGEMYWYGDGIATDMAAAEAWYRKSAGAGNMQAGEALEMLRQRGLRRADIAYWTSGYDGADLTAGKFGCARPDIPALSPNNADIKRVGAILKAWEECYHGFAANLNDALPPGKRVPADLANLMTAQEALQARSHLDQVYSRVGAAAQAAALVIVAERDAWTKATETNVAARTQMARLERENQLRQREMMNKEQAPRPAPAAPPPGR